MGERDEGIFFCQLVRFFIVLQFVCNREEPHKMGRGGVRMTRRRWGSTGVDISSGSSVLRTTTPHSIIELLDKNLHFPSSSC